MNNLKTSVTGYQIKPQEHRISGLRISGFKEENRVVSSDVKAIKSN